MKTRRERVNAGNRLRYDHDVFISYRRSNGASMALLIYQQLCEMGYRPYFDLEHMGGGVFDEQILRHIDECRDIVVILSEGATDWRSNREDDWMRREVAYALARGINVVPVFMPNYVRPANPEKTEPDDVREMYRYQGVTIDRTWTNAKTAIRDIGRYTVTRPIGYVMRQARKIVVAVCTSMLIAFATWQVAEVIKDKTVLLVGSGTVSTCLKNQPAIANDKRICIFDAASFEAFKMLQEVRNSSGNGKNVYVLVMAAARADLTSTDERFQNLREILRKEKLRLVEVRLQERDSLQVVFKPKEAFASYVNREDGTVPIEKLGELISKIQKDKMDSRGGQYLVYRTSKQSGTLATFNKNLPLGCQVNCDLTLDFHAEDDRIKLKMNEDNRIVVLCGKLYCPKEEMYKRDGGQMYTVTKDGKPIEKDLFLYFVIGENEQPSRTMRDFLKKIGREDVLQWIGCSDCLDKSGYVYVGRAKEL